MPETKSTSDPVIHHESAEENFLSISIALSHLKKAVEDRTKELESLNKELQYQNEEKEKRAAELHLANIELAFQNEEKEKRAAELIIANKELIYQNAEKEKRAAELHLANIELAFQNEEKEKRAAELIIANKELIYQNAEKEKRAEELLTANSELLAFNFVSSHDLQEPLRKIQIFSDYIYNNDLSTLSEKGKYYFSRIGASASYMQQLIEGILALSQISTVDNTTEHIELNRFFDGLSDEVKTFITEKSAVVDCSELGEGYVNFPQFQIMMDHLINNSLKFSKENTIPKITIKSEMVSGKTIGHIDRFIHTEKIYSHIIYSDNGIGFEPQFNEVIFEVFKRLNQKTHYQGVGVGLAIVKKIVRNHKGIILADSQLNNGARFDIFLPVPAN